MAALCRSYASHREAAEAVEAVLGAGVAGDRLLVLTGDRVRDARTPAVGGFAGSAPHDAPVGAFAGAPHPHDASMGAFAGGAQRGGSFADAARETVSSYPDGIERMHVTGRNRVLRLLRDAGLDAATARRDVEALHGGRVLLLVEDVAEADAERIGALLDG